MRSKHRFRLDSYYVIVNIVDFFGCGSRIYSNTNIAKNSLDLQKLLDYLGFKFKFRVQPVPPAPNGLMNYIHTSFMQEDFDISK